MDLKEQIDELRRMTDELTRHAGTNEAHQIAKVAERIYYLALEVKRVDDILQHWSSPLREISKSRK